jgi:pimeloyl-ACP methyl ester carboxylesterase
MIWRHTAVLGLALIVFREAGAQARTVVLPAGTPAVVLVHGRGQQGRTIQEVRRRFEDAFEEAQRTLLGRVIVPTSAVAFVWYADVIDKDAERPPTAMRCGFAEADTPERTARNKDLRDGLIALAERLNLDRPALKLFTQDTYQYLSDANARCEADSRLEQAIADARVGGRPLVIVAHSMGGIVTFASLWRNAQSLDDSSRLDVRRLVTVGTQVGQPLILKGLLGTFVAQPVPEPATIRSWVNFMNKGDMLAFQVRSSFKSTDSTRLPRDLTIDASGDRHAIKTYFSDLRVITAVLFAWCGAHPPVGRPTECGRLTVDAT